MKERSTNEQGVLQKVRGRRDMIKKGRDENKERTK